MPTKTTKKTIKRIIRKSPKQTSNKAEKELAEATKELTKEVKKLKSMEFIKVFKHPWKFMWFSFLKGVFIGLGTVFGVTVILSLVLYILGQIEVVPIVGDFVGDVIQEIQGYRN